MNISSTARRSGTVLAGAAATLALAAAPTFAHHCYKDSWTDAAHAQHSAGNTPWMPMSDYIAGALEFEFGLPAACVAKADAFTASWMAHKGITQEPLIQMRATAGGGAAHQGKDVKPFSYLGDADFGYLEGLLMAAPECAPPTEQE